MAAEVEGDGVPKALKNLLQRARFCTSHCQCVKREGFGHKSRSGHELRLLTAPEKEALKTQWLDEQALGKAGAAHLEEDRQGQLERREAAGVQHTEKLDQPWKLDFGKHKGKTLEQTDKADSGYLLHLVCSRVHEQRPTFRKALQETGRLDDALSKAPLLRHQSALRVLERSSLEDECGPSHPDVRKLRALQVAEAEAVLAEEAGSQQAEVQGQQAVAVPKKPPRRRPSRALVQLSHCLQCGDSGHKAPTCPHQSVPAPAATAVVLQTRLEKRKASLVAHLKYVSIHQRSVEYEERPAKRARAEVARGFQEMDRMTPRELTEAMLGDGLLADLTGAPCRNPRCDDLRKGYSANPVLGRLCSSKSTLWKDIYRRSKELACTAETAYY
ncbi:unnamed protein product [Polarella glacialis]|uniref:CCHC-type domain-containing protein n=2 Tax=Polarella glacialis TaxID=89957 RepID=A0A813LAE0_POLGL|nr:unnamed protein product [Polarella glacialis]